MLTNSSLIELNNREKVIIATWAEDIALMMPEHIAAAAEVAFSKLGTHSVGSRCSA